MPPRSDIHYSSYNDASLPAPICLACQIQAFTTDSNKLSASPRVILTMKLVDKGATMNKAAQLRSSTCNIPPPLTYALSHSCSSP